ncbi:MAG: CRISPR-associated protein Cas4 [Clostridiales bacterium]|jgi:CRISPR-associated exonuclease Cas4|nr:CRISPR-associated protein Cas4 [Clostridiales bacterium]
MISEDDYLLISGLQHFAFCRRQWALIHIEQQWEENFYTIDGGIMHDKAHDPFFTEKRGERIISRAVPIRSDKLHLTGVCDVVEFVSHPDGVSLFGREGKWQPYPVEYKRGSGSSKEADSLQLCAQAICLEEMLCCTKIERASLYYGELRHRVDIPLTDELRKTVEDMTGEMYELYRKKHTPTVKKSKKCPACSMKENCLPGISKQLSARAYLKQTLYEG